MYRFLLLALCGLFFFSLSGCEKQRSEPATASTQKTTSSTKLLTEAIEPEIYELPSGALATWREFAEHKPTLVLFSTHPLLDPYHPSQSTPAIRNLVLSGSSDEIIQFSKSSHNNPLLTPSQAVSAALTAELFSDIVFVLPTITKIGELSLEGFKKRLLAARFLSEEEAAGLTLDKGVYSGTVRGIPFKYVHPDALPEIDTPVVVHIDLGYFKDLYKNEVATPVYSLIQKTAETLKLKQYPTAAVSLSYSNQEIDYSLDIRFLIRNLAEVFRNPAMLDDGIPQIWAMRSQAMYFSSMFGETKSLETYEQIAAIAPDDADAQHSLAMVRFQQKRPQEAFDALDKAVKLDPGYALEYVDLAMQGKKQGRWKETIRLLTLANEALPEHPLFKIELADHLIRSGQGEKAKPLLEELQQLKWSPLFHPNILELLKQMKEVAEEPNLIHPEKSAK